MEKWGWKSNRVGWKMLGGNRPSLFMFALIKMNFAGSAPAKPVFAPEKLEPEGNIKSLASWPKSHNASLNIPAAVGWGRSSL